MKVLLFGATGMVGRGVLLECLHDPEVELVITVGRTATGIANPKLKEIVQTDMTDFSGIEPQLKGFDACFYCLGVSSAGMTESEYTRITYWFTMAAAEMLGRVNPGMTFIYVSGAGTDSTEKGGVMWARVKGWTENALLRMPPITAYMFRPGIIVPMDGIQSKTRSYRVFYSVLKPVLPIMRVLRPGHVLNTQEIGRAMLAVAKRGYARRVMETKDIRAALHSS